MRTSGLAILFGCAVVLCLADSSPSWDHDIATTTNLKDAADSDAAAWPGSAFGSVDEILAKAEADAAHASQVDTTVGPTQTASTRASAVAPTELFKEDDSLGELIKRLELMKRAYRPNAATLSMSPAPDFSDNLVTVSEAHIGDVSDSETEHISQLEKAQHKARLRAKELKLKQEAAQAEAVRVKAHLRQDLKADLALKSKQVTSAVKANEKLQQEYQALEKQYIGEKKTLKQVHVKADKYQSQHQKATKLKKELQKLIATVHRQQLISAAEKTQAQKNYTQLMETFNSVQLEAKEGKRMKEAYDLLNGKYIGTKNHSHELQGQVHDGLAAIQGARAAMRQLKEKFFEMADKDRSSYQDLLKKYNAVRNNHVAGTTLFDAYSNLVTQDQAYKHLIRKMQTQTAELKDKYQHEHAVSDLLKKSFQMSKKQGGHQMDMLSTKLQQEHAALLKVKKKHEEQAATAQRSNAKLNQQLKSLRDHYSATVNALKSKYADRARKTQKLQMQLHQQSVKLGDAKKLADEYTHKYQELRKGDLDVIRKLNDNSQQTHLQLLAEKKQHEDLNSIADISSKKAKLLLEKYLTEKSRHERDRAEALNTQKNMLQELQTLRSAALASTHSYRTLHKQFELDHNETQTVSSRYALLKKKYNAQHVLTKNLKATLSDEAQKTTAAEHQFQLLKVADLQELQKLHALDTVRAQAHDQRQKEEMEAATTSERLALRNRKLEKKYSAQHARAEKAKALLKKRDAKIRAGDLRYLQLKQLNKAEEKERAKLKTELDKRDLKITAAHANYKKLRILGLHELDTLRQKIEGQKASKPMVLESSQAPVLGSKKVPISGAPSSTSFAKYAYKELQNEIKDFKTHSHAVEKSYHKLLMKKFASMKKLKDMNQDLKKKLTLHEKQIQKLVATKHDQVQQLKSELQKEKKLDEEHSAIADDAKHKLKAVHDQVSMLTLQLTKLQAARAAKLRRSKATTQYKAEISANIHQVQKQKTLIKKRQHEKVTSRTLKQDVHTKDPRKHTEGTIKTLKQDVKKQLVKSKPNKTLKQDGKTSDSHHVDAEVSKTQEQLHMLTQKLLTQSNVLHTAIISAKKMSATPDDMEMTQEASTSQHREATQRVQLLKEKVADTRTSVLHAAQHLKKLKEMQKNITRRKHKSGTVNEDGLVADATHQVAQFLQAKVQDDAPDFGGWITSKEIHVLREKLKKTEGDYDAMQSSADTDNRGANSDLEAEEMSLIMLPQSEATPGGQTVHTPVDELKERVEGTDKHIASSKAKSRLYKDKPERMRHLVMQPKQDDTAVPQKPGSKHLQPATPSPSKSPWEALTCDGLGTSCRLDVFGGAAVLGASFFAMCFGICGNKREPVFSGEGINLICGILIAILAIYLLVAVDIPLVASDPSTAHLIAADCFAVAPYLLQAVMLLVCFLVGHTPGRLGDWQIVALFYAVPRMALIPQSPISDGQETAVALSVRFLLCLVMVGKGAHGIWSCVHSGASTSMKSDRPESQPLLDPMKGSNRTDSTHLLVQSMNSLIEPICLNQ